MELVSCCRSSRRRRGALLTAIVWLAISSSAFAQSTHLLVVVGLALHLTLLRATGAKWRVALVDNVDRLDNANLDKLLGGLHVWRAEHDAFDNVILAGALCDRPMPQNCNLETVGVVTT